MHPDTSTLVFSGRVTWVPGDGTEPPQVAGSSHDSKSFSKKGQSVRPFYNTSKRRILMIESLLVRNGHYRPAYRTPPLEAYRSGCRRGASRMGVDRVWIRGLSVYHNFAIAETLLHGVVDTPP